MKPTLCLAVALFAVLGLRAGIAPVFHVAPPPLGDDRNPGTAAAPFGSLDAARVAVRNFRTTHRDLGDIVVELQGGRYELTRPVRFEPADSGRPGSRVIYRAAPGGMPILSGGRHVTHWTSDDHGGWQASVGAGVDFRQLWIGDRRGVRARTPNVGQTFTLPNEKAEDGFDLLRVDATGWTARTNEVELAVSIAWMHKRLRIARLNDLTDRTLVRAVIAAPEWDAVTHQPQGDRVYKHRAYWLENAPEFLDAPGEFYLDRARGIVRYRPRLDEDVAALEIVRPELETLIELAGTPDAPVSDLTFEGLTFAHTGWTRPNQFGFVDVQANSLVPADSAAAHDPQYRHEQRKDRVPAAFQATTADRIVVRGCRFAQLGGTGVMFTHGGNDNVIEGNAFVDLAAGGIEFGEDAVHPTNPRLFPRRNRIGNNLLVHLGQDYFGSVAILGYYTEGSIIAHNEIVSVPYTAISQGWGWGLPPAPEGLGNNRILANRVSNLMRRLDDGGALYTTDRQPGSEIAHNFIEDVRPPNRETKAGGAIYLDQCSEGFHVHHNVVTGVLSWLNIWNPNIRGNRVDANYADTTVQRNDGTNNVVEPVQLLTAKRWPGEAEKIATNAGLEPAWTAIRAHALPTDQIIESTSVDLQPISGTWTPTERWNERYSAACLSTADADAVGRWLPILPRDGCYEISVWLPRGAPIPVYTLRIHRNDPQAVPVPKNIATGGWTKLGQFQLPAGSDVRLEVRAATPDVPVVADAVRFTWVRP